MSHLHNPDDPRHARLFDLLRKPKKVAQASDFKDQFHFRKVSAEEIERIKLRTSETLARRH